MKDGAKTDGKTIAVLLPDMQGGGAERVALNLAHGFLARGFDVDMVLMNARGELLAEVSSQIRVVDLGVARMRGLLVPLVRYLKTRRPSALLAVMWPLTAISVIAAMFCRHAPRIVVSDHNALSRSTASISQWRRWLLKKSIRWLYPYANAVVVVSGGVADDMTALTGLPANLITTIYNPVARGKLPAPLAIDDQVGGWRQDGYQRLITVGTLKAQKDHRTLITAFAKLRAQRPVKLLILGDGALRGGLLSQAQELGVSDDVFLPGFVPDPYPYYLAADLFVLSSAYEGFGNVLVEALECGLPVVSTDCVAGPREILAGGKYGWLVPVNDPAALAEAMIAALRANHNRENLIRRGREFSTEKAANAYLELLSPQQGRRVQVD